jgi:hypothetical protein
MTKGSFLQSQKRIAARFKQYSFDDIARALFTFSTWLPNIASLVRLQFLYTTLESLRVEDFKEQSKIKNYEDFTVLCSQLIEGLPSFPSLEDYVPEPDWGQIKYFYDNQFYRILYGSEFSNIYDYYSSFEIIHRPFEDYYVKATNRSPIQELEFCLKLQDYFIEEVTTQPIGEELELHPGDLCIPTKDFWQETSSVLDRFSPEFFSGHSLISKYTRDVNTSGQSKPPSAKKFINSFFQELNCSYFFLKCGSKYYPTLIRRYFPILFEIWNKILAESYTKIQEEEKNPEISIGLELHRYVRDRVDESNVYELASPVSEDLKPSNAIFTTALHTKDQLLLIHITPPSVNKSLLESYLQGITSDLKESLGFLSHYPTRLGLRARQEIVEFRSNKECRILEPQILIIIPYSSTAVMRLRLPEDLPGEIIGLDQFVGIIDEIDDIEELASFFDYVKDTEISLAVSPMNSYLDKFGAFKDSHGVLVRGASEYNFILLDTQWGSRFRYESLSQFYKFFPDTIFFGHPRSWIVERSEEGVLRSKTFFGYAYYQKIENAYFFINTPADLMTFEQGKITDLLMRSLSDGLKIYSEQLKELSYSEHRNRFQVIFFPNSLAQANARFSHLSHLLPNGNVWKMDIKKLAAGSYGIRVVFDEQNVISTLHNTKDRSAQIDLLISVLEQINTRLGDQNFQRLLDTLEQERSKKSRFKFFNIRKKASFPETIGTLVPETADFKKARKDIAKIANELALLPGTYTLDEGKGKVEQLIKKVVEKLNDEVSKYQFKESIQLLVEKADALTNEYEIDQHQFKSSLDQEVDYEREKRSNQSHAVYVRNYRNFRYLIEKFVQLQPKGEEELGSSSLRYLLALVDKLRQIYSANDLIWYGIFPTEITIDHDYLVSINHSIDLEAMEDEFGKEQAQIDLGIVGNSNDVPKLDFPLEDYIEEIDKAFDQDFGFSMRDLVNVLEVMSLWPFYKGSENDEAPYYIATEGEIAEVCLKSIEGINEHRVSKALHFLTLDPETLLKVEDQVRLCEDLPVWEHRKRTTRYTIKPLIRIGDSFLWGPCSTHQSCGIWANILHLNRLPADFKAKAVQKILEKGHKSIEESLVIKSEEIVSRFTSFVIRERDLHKIDKAGKHPPSLGDYDVLAFLENKNLLLYIECKIIDPPYCLKDTRRLREKIFGRVKGDGTFQEGYLQKVERRAQYLPEHTQEIMAALNWGSGLNQPKVISVFLTQLGFWWTKFPPVETSIRFVQIQKLEAFVSAL